MCGNLYLEHNQDTEWYRLTSMPWIDGMVVVTVTSSHVGSFSLNPQWSLSVCNLLNPDSLMSRLTSEGWLVCVHGWFSHFDWPNNLSRVFFFYHLFTDGIGSSHPITLNRSEVFYFFIYPPIFLAIYRPVKMYSVFLSFFHSCIHLSTLYFCYTLFITAALSQGKWDKWPSESVLHCWSL